MGARFSFRAATFGRLRESYGVLIEESPNTILPFMEG